MSPSMNAQATQLGFSNSPPAFGHGHDYIQLLNETVNPADGSLTLKIGIPTPAGRGANFSYALTYNSSVMRSFSQGTGPNTSPVFMTPISAPNNTSTYTFGGWSDTLPKLVVEHTPYAEIDSMPPENDQQTTLIICEAWKGFQFTDLSGQTHQTNLNVGNLYSEGDGCNLPLPGAYNTGFDATSQGHAAVGAAAEYATSDGTYYEFSLASNWPGGAVILYPQLIEDRNGNNISIVNSSNNSTQLIGGYYTIGPNAGGISVLDTLGRSVINLQHGTQNNELINVSGLPKPYSINFSSTPALTGTHTPQASTILEGPTYQGGSNMDTINAFPAQGPRIGLTSLTLPDGGSYGFTYDSVFGNVNRITYPNGGYVSYIWGFPGGTSDNPGGYSDDANYGGQYVTCAGSCPSPTEFWTPFRVYVQYAMPVILHREVSFDGSTVALTQDFNYQTTFRPGDMMSGWATKTTTVITNDLVAGTTFSVTYSYSPFTVYALNYSQRYTGQQAQEYQILYKDGNGKVLQTVCKTWADGLGLLYTQKTILANGMVSEHDFDYTATGVSGAPTGGDDYDFSAPQSNPTCLSPYSPNFLSGAPTPGPLLRSTRQTSNLTATSPISMYPYAPSIGDIPSSSITKDGSGNIVAETDYQYTDAIAQTVKGVVQHDTSFDSGSQVRQNLLSATKRCFPLCPSVTTTYSYDNTGQVISTSDSLGNTTTYSYADSYVISGGQPSSTTNAYITNVTEPMTNGISHVQEFTYGYNDGKIRTITDENSNVTTYCYWTGGCAGSAYDPWMRLTQVQYPDGGSKSAAYNDAGVSPTVVTSTLLNPSSTLIQTAIGDGMGHVVRSQTNSDPVGTVTVDTVYDGTGAVFSTSNPYRSTSDTTYGMTSYTYDGLGRKILQTQPDGSVLQWCYNGTASISAQRICTANLSSLPNASWVDTVDEAGNRSQQISDGIGRLVAVMEPDPGSDVPDLETDYTYSALSNLLNVTQKGNSTTAAADTPHLRSYSYDSLSRLISAQNPETGTQTYTYSNGGVLCAGDPSVPCSKTDSRGVITSYNYDSLTRLISKSYSGGGDITPAACYQYDGQLVPNGIGRMAAEWIVNGACASAPPATAYQSLRRFLAYDTLGRLQNEQQCILRSCTAAMSTLPKNYSCPNAPPPPYFLTYCYDLAGDVVYSTTAAGSPGGPNASLGFAKVYDGSGRLAAVTSSWGDFLHPSNLFTVSPANGYTPSGALQNWMLGLNINLSSTYDDRLRITGTSATQR